MRECGLAYLGECVCLYGSCDQSWQHRKAQVILSSTAATAVTRQLGFRLEKLSDNWGRLKVEWNLEIKVIEKDYFQLESEEQYMELYARTWPRSQFNIHTLSVYCLLMPIVSISFLSVYSLFAALFSVFPSPSPPPPPLPFTVQCRAQFACVSLRCLNVSDTIMF